MAANWHQTMLTKLRTRFPSQGDTVTALLRQYWIEKGKPATGLSLEDTQIFWGRQSGESFEVTARRYWDAYNPATGI